MKMKPIATLLVLFLGFPAISRADDASKRAKVEQLFTLVHLDQRMQQATEAQRKQTLAAMEGMIPAQMVGERYKQQMMEFEKQLVTEMQAKAGWEAEKAEYINLYAATFSEEEVDGVLAFYRSLIGAKYLEKSFVLSTEALKISERHMQELQPELEQLMEKFIRSMDVPPTRQPNKPASDF